MGHDQRMSRKDRGAALLLALGFWLMAALPARAFDVYAVEVLGVKLGMTRAEVIQQLEDNNLQIGGNYTRNQERRLGTEALLLPTLEGDALEFRLKEYTAGGRYPSFNLSLTYPTPGDPQRLWALQYLTQFGADTPAEVVVNSVIQRYGEPGRASTSTDGLERYLYYGGLSFNPYFDDTAQAATGNTGLYVRVRTHTQSDPLGVLEIQLGDYQLWQEKEQALQIYKRVYATQQQQTQQQDRSVTGGPKF